MADNIKEKNLVDEKKKSLVARKDLVDNITRTDLVYSMKRKALVGKIKKEKIQ